MRSIPEAVEAAIERDGFLHFGLSNGILSLTKTAKFLLPLVKARTKKDASVSAITMALSRLKVKKRRTNAALKAIRLKAINTYKNLSEISYEKTAAHVAAIEEAERRARRENGYLVVTIGTGEITVLTEEKYLQVIKKTMDGRPKVEINGLSAIGVQFDERYMEHVGMVYTLVQQLTFQNINIVEFSSTYTELIFYVAKKDLKLAFDTLYDQFM